MSATSLNMEIKVETKTFGVESQVTLVQQSYKMMFAVCAVTLFLLNLQIFFPITTAITLGRGIFLFLLYLVILVVDALAFAYLIGGFTCFLDGDLIGNVWHFDFDSCILVHRKGGIVTSLPFGNIIKVTVAADDVLFFFAQRIVIEMVNGNAKIISPVLVPSGLIQRLKHACKNLRPTSNESVSTKCQLPCDAELSQILNVFAETHKQTATFWKQTSWFPKQKKTSAYYQIEKEDQATNGNLWRLSYIKEESVQEEEWKLEALGTISPQSWSKLCSSLL